MSSPCPFSYSLILSSVSWSSSLPWNIWLHKSSTVLLSISAASPSLLKLFSYNTVNSWILFTMFTSSICFLNLSLHKYDNVIRRCIKTLTSIGYLMNLRMLSIMLITVSGLLVRLIWHHFECTTLASIAVAKSKQNIWILVLKDLLTRFKTHEIISCSR